MLVIEELQKKEKCTRGEGGKLKTEKITLAGDSEFKKEKKKLQRALISDTVRVPLLFGGRTRYCKGFN